VGSCSAAIGAACYRLPMDEMAYEKLVIWGVIDETDDEGNINEVGHC